jgi:Domain of unknown function (DUF4174)
MNPFHCLVLSLFLAATPVAAQDDDPLIRPASQAALSDFLWLKRPVLVFADSPQDPNYIRQMELIERDATRLPAYDIVVITDTDPAARSEFRKRFRPRGFSLVMMDKDGITTLRKPLPWEVREITNAMDKFPTVRQEMLDRYPSGR